MRRSGSFRPAMGRGRTRTRSAAAIACAVPLFVGACGGDAEKPNGVDLTAVRCPLVATGEQVGGVEQYEPARDSFDTGDLIGARVGDARAPRPPSTAATS